MHRRSRSALDDPVTAARAWRRYRRMMTGMALLTVLIDVAAVAYVLGGIRHPTISLVVATLLGVTFTMLVGTGLMLLVFLSAGTGHDQEVQDGIGERGR